MEYLIFFVQVVMLAAIGVALFVFFNFFKKRDLSPPTLPSEFIKWKQDAQDIILEIEKVGREVVENVEEKIKILKRVVKEAEDKIQQLDKKIEHLAGISIKIPRVYEDEISILPTKEDIFSPLSQNRYTKIHHLADQGWEISEIAREVNVGKGEVQLILDLKKEMKR